VVPVEEQIDINDYQISRNVFGNKDKNIKVIEEKLDVKIIARGSNVKIEGNKEDVDLSSRVIEEMVKLAKTGKNIDKRQVKYAVELLSKNRNMDLGELYDEVLQVNFKGRKKHGL